MGTNLDNAILLQFSTGASLRAGRFFSGDGRKEDMRIRLIVVGHGSRDGETQGFQAKDTGRTAERADNEMASTSGYNLCWRSSRPGHSNILISDYSMR